MLATENINKNRVVIPKAWEGNCNNEKKRKLRETDSETVNIPIFSQMYSGHCCYRAITSNKPRKLYRGFILKVFRRVMGCSKGSRQGKTNYRVISGEEAVIDIEAAEEWKSKLQNLLNEYPPENQFNAAEIGLFYRQMPRKKDLSREVKNIKVGNFPKKD
jgi:hypothetical protein